MIADFEPEDLGTLAFNLIRYNDEFHNAECSDEEPTDDAVDEEDFLRNICIAGVVFNLQAILKAVTDVPTDWTSMSDDDLSVIVQHTNLLRVETQELMEHINAKARKS